MRWAPQVRLVLVSEEGGPGERWQAIGAWRIADGFTPPDAGPVNSHGYIGKAAWDRATGRRDDAGEWFRWTDEDGIVDLLLKEQADVEVSRRFVRGWARGDLARALFGAAVVALLTEYLDSAMVTPPPPPIVVAADKPWQQDESDTAPQTDVDDSAQPPQRLRDVDVLLAAPRPGPAAGLPAAA